VESITCLSQASPHHLSLLPPNLVTQLRLSLPSSSPLCWSSGLILIILDTLQCLGSSTPVALVKDAVGLYLLLKRSYPFLPSSTPRDLHLLRKLSLSPAQIETHPCHLLFSAFAQIYSSSPAPPPLPSPPSHVPAPPTPLTSPTPALATPRVTEEVSVFVQYFTKHPKFQDPILQTLLDSLHSLLSAQISAEATSSGGVSKRGQLSSAPALSSRRHLKRTSQQLQQQQKGEAGMDCSESRAAWKLLTHLIFFFIVPTPVSPTPTSASLFPVPPPVATAVAAEVSPNFCHLSASNQKRYLSLCLKYLKLSCEQCSQQIKQIQSLLSRWVRRGGAGGGGGRGVQEKSEQQRHKPQQRQRRRLQQQPKQRKVGPPNEVWVAKDEEDSDYVDCGSEGEEEEGEDSDSRSSSGDASDSDNSSQEERKIRNPLLNFPASDPTTSHSAGERYIPPPPSPQLRTFFSCCLTGIAVLLSLPLITLMLLTFRVCVEQEGALPHASPKCRKGLRCQS
jgi:hypothetical protein